MPLPGIDIVLLRGKKMLAACGEEAELLTAGLQTFSGSVGEPELSCQSMVSLSWLPHHHFYTSGDYGRYNGDMQIELLGRKDSQFKVSGQRVEAEEIEFAINSASEVCRSAVILHNMRLHAFIQLKASFAYESILARIKSHCLARFPPALVPTVSIVAEIPLTPSLKIDRARLISLKETMNYMKTDTDYPIDANDDQWLDNVIQNILGVRVIDPDVSLQSQVSNSIGFIRLKGMLAR